MERVGSVLENNDIDGWHGRICAYIEVCWCVPTVLRFQIIEQSQKNE